MNPFASQSVSKDHARSLVEAGAVLLDVRSPEEFAAEHIDGAVNVPLQQLAARHDELGPKQRPIVLYCRSGARSAQAASLLRSAGWQRVHDLGAMLNWK